MKLILSRKGFDSSAGGVPSPIFPDGQMLSLPIPDDQSVIRYGDIRYFGGSMGNLVASLTKQRITADHHAHLDPDLIKTSITRSRGWQPLFGQTGSAQSHLRNNGVGPGDLFVFFGLFRTVELQDGVWRWAKESNPKHVIWGWMQVDKKLTLAEMDPFNYSWAHSHPHWGRVEDTNNHLYVGRRNLEMGGNKTKMPGAGVFPRFYPQLQLTAPDADRVSLWQLPGCFYPGKSQDPLTYHKDRKRWRKTGGKTELMAAARGQEFVLNGDQYPKALDWAYGLIEELI